MSELIYITPELFLTFAINVLILIGVYLNKKQGSSYASMVVSQGTVVSLIVTAILLFYHYSLETKYLFNHLLVVDGLADFSKLIVTILCIIMIVSINSRVLKDFESYIIMLISLLGMFLVISSNDFFLLFLSIELQSFCLYILAASNKSSIYSLEGGLKYFILGAFSSVILLLGIVLLYGDGGTTNFSELYSLYYDLYVVFQSDRTFKVLFLAMGLIFVGLFFKLPLAPFHSWAPDVYSAAPTYITGFFATVPKLSIIVAIVRIVRDVFSEFSEYWIPLFTFSAVLSMIIGCFGALYNYNKNLKRLLAYSSITHAGFILVGFLSNSVEGIAAILFYSVIYLFISSTIFLIMIHFVNKEGQFMINNVEDLSVIFKENKILGYAFVINLFSMAGLPPLAGFFSKFFILESSINSDFPLLLPVLVVTVSSISCFYYINAINKSVFEMSVVSSNSVVRLSSEAAIILYTLTFVNIFFILDFNDFFLLCLKITKTIF